MDRDWDRSWSSVRNLDWGLGLTGRHGRSGRGGAEGHVRSDGSVTRPSFSGRGAARAGGRTSSSAAMVRAAPGPARGRGGRGGAGRAAGLGRGSRAGRAGPSLGQLGGCAGGVGRAAAILGPSALGGRVEPVSGRAGPGWAGQGWGGRGRELGVGRPKPSLRWAVREISPHRHPAALCSFPRVFI